MNINAFTIFRAIAIILIVAGHCFGFTGLEFNSGKERVVANLLSGGTGLFVFISGFLFHHVFYEEFSYKKFIVNKFKNILVPYLLLSSLPVAAALIFSQISYSHIFPPSGAGVMNEYVIPTFDYYWHGQIFDAYWYISFIMITFLLSPFHVRFVNIRLSFQVAIIIVLSCISILMHRPVENMIVFQSLLYFTPFYLIGITCSINKVQLYKKLDKKEIYFFVAILILAVIQTLSGHTGSYHKPALELNGFDFMFIQKILLCFFLMIFLNRFKNFNNKIIDMVATTSFATFFLHGFIIAGACRINARIFHKNSWLVFSLTVASIIICCIFIAKITKYVAPRYSRLLTGY